MAPAKTYNEFYSEEDIGFVRRKGYTLSQLLGEGSYAKVYAAHYSDPNPSEKKKRENLPPGKRPETQRLACKVIDGNLAPDEFIEKFLPRELSIITKLDHRHVVRTHSILYMSDLKKWFVFMQLGDNGDLLKFLLEYGPLKERRARIVFSQLLSAVEYLHSKSIAHRDIKCENVLLTRGYNIKLSDFGFARYVDKNPDTDEYVKSSTFCGSLQYAAPEIIRGKEYNPFKVDMWSMGVFLYIILNKALPFEDGSRKAIYVSQMKKQWTWRKAITESISNRLKQFLPRLLQPQADRRADIEELKTHQWLTVEVDTSRKSSSDNSSSHSQMTLKALPSGQGNIFVPLSSKIIEFDGKAMNIAMAKDTKLSLPDDYRHSLAVPMDDEWKNRHASDLNEAGSTSNYPELEEINKRTKAVPSQSRTPNPVKAEASVKNTRKSPDKK